MTEKIKEESPGPHTQEIRIQAQLTLEVPIELSREELLKRFDGALVTIPLAEGEYLSVMDIIEIEEEAQIYGTEPDQS